MLSSNVHELNAYIHMLCEQPPTQDRCPNARCVVVLPCNPKQADVGKFLGAHRSSMSSEYGVAGRLLNALRQECVHQLKVPMDNLRLVTVWDRSRLQVSNIELPGLCWLHNVHELHSVYQCCIHCIPPELQHMGQGLLTVPRHLWLAYAGCQQNAMGKSCVILSALLPCRVCHISRCQT